MPDDRQAAEILTDRRSNRIPMNELRKLDIFSVSTAGLVLDLIRTQLRCEGSAETLREMLSRNAFFNATEAFRMIDHGKTGQITKDELRLHLEQHGHFVSETDARALAKKFDTNLDGKITF